MGLIALIHRPGGWVNFGIHGRPGGFQLCASNRLDNELEESGRSASLMSLNQHRPGREGRDGKGRFRTRGSASVTFLTAVMARVPGRFHRSDRQEALLRRVADCGHVPAPSVAVFNGDHAALLWLLKAGGEAGRPVAATNGPDGTMARYGKVATKANRLLAASGVRTDPHAVKVTAELTLPRGRSRWEVLGDKPQLFELEELADAVGEYRPMRRARRSPVKKAASQPDPERRQRLAGLHVHRADALRQLVKLRGKFDQKVGRDAMRYMALFLKGQGVRPDAILGELREINAVTVPSLPSASVKGIIKGLRGSPPHVEDQTIADSLDLSPDEAAKLRASLVNWPPASRRLNVADLNTRRPNAAWRGRKLEEWAKRENRWPTATEWANWLLSEGHPVSRQTAWRDVRSPGEFPYEV